MAEATTSASPEEHRQRWLPVLAASRLAEPDGHAARLALLGEELAAFRDTDGVLGVIDGRCPHNGSLLFWGVAEEGALNCAYHNWAFDVRGRCVWAPGTSNAPDSLSRYNLQAYPLVESGGVLWTFMGTGEAPALPGVPWPSEGAAGTHWQVLAPTPEAALETQRAAIGWPAEGGALGGSLLAGPGALRLWFGVVPSMGQGFHCLAMLWHLERPLTEPERAAMTDRASGPVGFLADL